MNGYSIKIERKKQELSLRQLSALTGGEVSASTISRIERGIGDVFVSHLTACYKALGLVDTGKDNEEIASAKHSKLKLLVQEIETLLETDELSK